MLRAGRWLNPRSASRMHNGQLVIKLAETCQHLKMPFFKLTVGRRDLGETLAARPSRHTLTGHELDTEANPSGPRSADL